MQKNMHRQEKRAQTISIYAYDEFVWVIFITSKFNWNSIVIIIPLATQLVFNVFQEIFQEKLSPTSRRAGSWAQLSGGLKPNKISCRTLKT